MSGKAVLSDEDEIEVEEDEREEPEGDAVDPEDHDDEDDEEDEEGEDEYEKDGFIVDDVDEDDQDGDEEDRADSDEEKQKKKKRKKRESEKNYALDEDDYELLQDNNVGFRRPKQSKYKRLKKARAEVDEAGFFDEEEYDATGNGARSAEDKIKRSLFDDDEGQPLEDIAEEDQPEIEEDADIGEDDEMADFIVDEEEVDEHGEPTRRRKVIKKKNRQAPGVSSSAMQEAHEIFGDVDELIKQRKLGLERINRYADAGEWKEKKLEDEFEPIILSEKYMTENDDRIREIDIPERMQISEESTGPPPTDEFSIGDESNWILNQLPHELVVVKKDIVRFLEFMHVQKLDVPFISMYRKEECRSLFTDDESQADSANEDDSRNKNKSTSEKKPTMTWHKTLWSILDLDKKWLLLQKRKNALQLYYNKRFEEERSIYDETRLHMNQKLFDSITKSLEIAESEKEIDDVDLKFNLHFPPGDIGIDEGQFKRPKRKSQYSICSKSGLWEVASKFGYSSEEFGQLISLEQMRVPELVDAKETPEEVASRFTCAMFEDSQAVLRGARHMAAVEISCEPCVRRHVRSIFMENAVVSTRPTAEGNISIDSNHQFAGIKWLKDKPLTRFNDAQWLLIQKAEEEKLVQVTVQLPEQIHIKLFNDVHDCYCSDGVSKSAQLWNEQRKQIIKDGFDGLLLPSMAKEARALLTSKAKNFLLTQYGNLLWDKVSVGPYPKRENDAKFTEDYEAPPRVMACCWGPGKPATTFVMLDPFGEIVDVLYAGAMNIKSQNANEIQRKKHDQERVLRFMTEHQPHIVVLGAVNVPCLKLKDDIFEIICQIVEHHPRDMGRDMVDLKVVSADENLPHLYENSRISSDQLQPQPGIVKRAVALGRYHQNPLAMVATLCGPSKEILSWKLSPLESFLTPDEKYSMVEQIMVDATNQVGLDINLAISHEWLFAPLQFISGLGPRKAASLQRSLVRASSIYTRKDLLNHGLGKKVFVNAVGFLRVRRSGNAANGSQFIDLLDDTRIHPESYGLAQELAKDMYTSEAGEDVNDDEDMLEMAIEHVRENPNMLKNLQVDNYARDKNRENKIDTLNHTRLELIHGFQDWRKWYQEPKHDEEIYMVTGETEETFSEGKMVQVTVFRVQPNRAICVLESGSNGLLNKEDFSDERRDGDLTESLNEGDVLTCKIKQIQKKKDTILVFLSCKENDLRNDRARNKILDPYYYEDRDTAEIDKEKARKAKELAKKHFKSRMIVHPRFQNITADEAMEMLSDKEPGESIVRPSSRGYSYLTLTLKIYEGVYAHKDIIEGGKENMDMTSLSRLGKTLKIGEDVFEDLDEVMDRYVDPLVTHLKTMLAYRKFREGGKAEVDESLRKEKNENPSRIVYAFGISHEHPGTFILTYIRSSNPHHEYVGLYPKGFKFRKKMFEEIDRLVAYFQRHIDDPHDAGPSIRSVAAMVPMRSPATGGSSGGLNSDGGGYRGDRERMSTPSSRGRGDYSRNGGGHESGVPRPYGGGRGRGRGGRGSYNHSSGGGGGGNKKVQPQSGGASAGWASGW